MKAGESAKELASAINSDSKATVYAAVLESGTIVLSNRATGNTGGEFIKVTDAGDTLVEKAGTAKEGQNAEYTVDGVAGTSASNTVTNAIAGVTLTLSGLTPTGPVTIDVQPPGPSASAVEAQVQSFIKLYNSTVEAIQKQLTTKPLAKAAERERIRHRHAVRRPRTDEPARQHARDHVRTDRGPGSRHVEPVRHRHQHRRPDRLAELLAGLARRAVDARTDQAHRSGQDQPRRRRSRCSRSWSQDLQGMIDEASEAGGGLEARINGDTTQITELSRQIASMNEVLAEREKALQQTYAELESVISQNTNQAAFIARQSESLSTTS